jgi:hypothetical protein
VFLKGNAMKMPMIRYLTLCLCSISAYVPAVSIAAESQQAVVLAIHSEQSTRAFVADHRLPAGQAQGGRFAVVKLINGAWGEGSYALVYVPARLSATRNDRVELVPTDSSILTTPGKGVVIRVSHSDGLVR